MYGGADDKLPACIVAVRNNKVFEINGIRVTCSHTPCHTRGSTLFFFEPLHPVVSMQFSNDRVAGYQVVRNVDKCVFTGDTIFVGSIGVLFEGEAKEIVHAVQKVLVLIIKIMGN